jgi:WD40 repeat protein
VSPDGTLGVTLNGVGEDVIRLVNGARVSHLDAFALTGWIFSNDNRYVAAPSSQAPDGTTRLHVFDVASGTLVTTFDPGGAHLTLTGFPKGGGALALENPGGFHLWSLPDGALLRDIPGPALNIAFSPDGALLAVSDWQETRLLDTTTGAQREALPTSNRGIDGGTVGLTYARTGNIGTVDGEGVLRLWCSP